ncbi:MAG: membrane protein insertion efficiency factor YidD [Terriglobia bacterium]
MESLKKIFLCCLGLYKSYLSPFLPPSCRFLPTCSDYASQAITKYGVWHGSLLAVRRLGKCHPFHEGGCDPLR